MLLILLDGCFNKIYDNTCDKNTLVYYTFLSKNVKFYFNLSYLFIYTVIINLKVANTSTCTAFSWKYI